VGRWGEKQREDEGGTLRGEQTKTPPLSSYHKRRQTLTFGEEVVFDEESVSFNGEKACLPPFVPLLKSPPSPYREHPPGR
jgi:hypothetical protein